MKNNTARFTRGNDNIFADIGVDHADEFLLKADIAVIIGRLIKDRGLTQKEAAARLGLAQPDISRILRGELGGYSLERLLGALRALGSDIEIRVKPARGARAGRIRMQA